MPAPQVSEPKILDLHELSTNALLQGPVVVNGLAEVGQVSVLWYENDLCLRRDFEEESQAYGLVRAIASAGARQSCSGARWLPPLTGVPRGVRGFESLKEPPSCP